MPHYFAVWEQAGLFLAGLMATYMPQLVVPRVAAKLRNETHGVILPAEEQELRVYLDERYRTGTRLNLNQLGEAILGEREADHRLHIYLSLLERYDVEYISVKISSIVSQLNLIAFEQPWVPSHIVCVSCIGRRWSTPTSLRVDGGSPNLSTWTWRSTATCT